MGSGAVVSGKWGSRHRRRLTAATLGRWYAVAMPPSLGSLPASGLVDALLSVGNFPTSL
jgi:hypothetical protein